MGILFNIIQIMLDIALIICVIILLRRNKHDD